MSEINDEDNSVEFEYPSLNVSAKSLQSVFKSKLNNHRTDLMFNPDVIASGIMQEQELRKAAVLIPLINRENDLYVLLTQRSKNMSSHAGQISFPGGTFEEQDNNDAVKTALRETHEEVGIDPSFPNVLGTLPRYQTVSGFDITPVVALLEPHFELRLQASEVESAFEVPFSFLTDPSNYSLEYMLYEGKNRAFYKAPFGERGIWGATAGMLFGFYEILARHHQ